MGISDYLRRRKLNREIEEGMVEMELMMPRSAGAKFKQSRAGGAAYRGVKAGYGFVDDLYANKGGRKRTKRKGGAFGKIKDKGLIEGGFF
jgi:hypothetical protein